MGEPPIFFLTEAGVYQKLRWNPIARAAFPSKGSFKKTFPLKAVSAAIQTPVGRLHARVCGPGPARGNPQEKPVFVIIEYPF